VWRQSGALVAADKERSGIWVFGKSNSATSSLPLCATTDSAGFVEVEDIKLEIKNDGTYESSSLWKPLKATAISSNSHNSASSPSVLADNSVRTNQSLNAKVSPSSVGLGHILENSAVTNTTKGESTTLEHVVEFRDIQEHFISAVLASLSYRLCDEGGLTALNARTLVSPISACSKNDAFSQVDEKSTYQKRVPMITLDVHLTSLGTLVVKASVDTSSDISCLRYLGQSPLAAGFITEGTTLFLAPSGKIARYYGPLKDEDRGQAVSKTEHSKEQYLDGDTVTSYAIDRWKIRCVSWLQNKGIQAKLLEDCPWIMVEILTRTTSFDQSGNTDGGLWTPEEKLITIPWPSALCFQRATYGASENALPKSFHGYDPLAFAEKWLNSKAEREIIIAKRQKDRDSTAAAIRTQAEIDTRNLASNNHSPIALRRASNAGAVYPTPPDGIQHLIGATPSFNDNASTPGNVNQQPPQPDHDQMVVTRSEVEDTEGNLWETNIGKRDRIPGLDFNDGGNDNIFSDLGGELFGENDITDADFNFFDEPDRLEDTKDKMSVEENDDAQESKSGATPAIVAKSLDDSSNLAALPDSLMTEDNFGTIEGQVVKNKSSSSHGVHSDRDMPREPEVTSSLTYSVPRPPSPPLSPELVFKRLLTTEATPEDRRDPLMLEKTISAFGSVEFDSSLSIFNEKYGSHGRFICPSIPKSTIGSISAALPSTGYLRKRRKLKPNAVDSINQALQSPMELVPESENSGSQSDIESRSQSPTLTPLSNQGGTSETTEDGAGVLLPSVKRKRESDDVDEEDEMASSFQDLNVNNSPSIHASDPLDLLSPALLEWDPADWSLSSYFSCPEPRNVTSVLSDTEYIASAQLLADQAIFGTLKIPLLTDRDEIEGIDNRAYRNSTANQIRQTFAQVVKSSFDQATECSMAMFTEVQDIQPFSQINRLTPRPIPNPRGQHSELTKPSSTFPLPAPHIEVRRAESKLTVLPSAASFWENLGLAPCKGSKDVSAICIYPDGEGMTENVSAFLDHTRSAYESGRFGTHERFCHTDVPNGLFPMDFGESNALSVADHQALLLRIKDTATRVGSILVSGSIEEANIVIYYIYDSANPELLVPICSAFYNLFAVYKDGLSEEKLPVANELVLQFIPLDFVASRTALVVPRPSEYSRLAMEVYDRCVDLKSGTSPPSIVLEQPLPRSIDFKITPNPSANLLQENSCMHVAYAQSIDDRWVTAAWTDNIGSQQMTASYCLGRKGVPLTTSFSDVAHEIWETTLDIIALRKVHWRILICKCGVMDPPEMDFWKGLASTESKAQVSLTLLTVDTNPSLNLLPLSISLPPSILTGQSVSYTTPVSTPSASMVSPEQSGNAGTPARDPSTTNAATPSESNPELKIDADATLVDIRDQTWGAILSHRLNNSRSLLEFNPTLVSGYLIKRTGATISDVPAAMEVNVVHSEANSRMYDALLREILGHYRGLGTLARVRGCVNPVKDCRPWHIAAAEKGVRVLYMLM
jgi:mediator of RNA polymerase II transcription subunit 13, fungi type